MEGKLGAIYIGKRQVGGFEDWKLNLNMTEGADRDGNKTAKIQSWKLSSWSYWVFKALSPGDKVRLMLCADVGSVYWEGNAVIACRLSSIMSTLIHTRLEIIGSGELTARTLDEQEDATNSLPSKENEPVAA